MSNGGVGNNCLGQKSALLYGCETWKITQTISHKLQSSVNACLRTIINSRWPEVISNHDLWGKPKQKPISTEIQKKEMEVDRTYT
jgi:hypothetical protein